MTSSPERYAKLQLIFEEARRASGEQRDQILDRQCEGDAQLRSEVQQLLDAVEGDTKDMLEETGIHQLREALNDVLDENEEEGTTESTWTPERVGPYRVLRHIADGGMGTVYEAEQESPRRKIALKIIHPLFVTPSRLKRFRQEAELLGRLTHPGIGRIFEAGSYDLGRGSQPYFAMEFVDGEDLVSHAKSKDLPTSERVALMIEICEALQHAHDKGVVHRDLKPDNVLVDRSGQVKVLDFGIARDTEGSTLLTTMSTAEGDLLGTLAYMAPEQLAGDSQAISNRSDVYALGVLAFQLLGGRLPHDILDLPISAAVALVQERDPVRLGKLSQEFSGDLETIIGKALEKEPARRYASAQAMADDLRAHLEHRPISARPPSRSYRAVKFTRRNKALVGGVCATLLATLIGLVVSLLFASRASQNATLAQQETRRTRAALQQAILDLAEGSDYWKSLIAFRQVSGASQSWDSRFLARTFPPVVPGEYSTPAIELVDDSRAALSLGETEGRAIFDIETWTRTGEFLRDHPAPHFLEDEMGVRRWSQASDDGRSVTFYSDHGELGRLETIETEGRFLLPADEGPALQHDYNRGVLRQFDLSSGEMIGELNGLRPSSCGRLWILPGAREFLTWDKTRRLIRVDLASFEILHRFEDIKSSDCSGGDVSRDGSLFAHGPDGRPVEVFDLGSGQLVYQLTAKLLSGGGHRVRFSPSGKKLVVIGEDTATCILDIHKEPWQVPQLNQASDPRQVTFERHEKKVWDHAFSPDGRLIASASPEESVLRIWDSWTSEELTSLPKPRPPHAYEYHSGILLAFSPDGRRVLITERQPDSTGSLVEYDLLTGSITTHQNPECQSGSSHLPWLDVFLELLGDAGPMRIGRRVVLLSNGSALAAQDNFGWRVPVGERWDEFHYVNEQMGLALSPDERFAALACARTVRLYERNGTTPLDSFPGQAFCVDWSPDGQLIAAAGHSGRVRLIDPELEMEILNFKAHDSWIMSLSWSPNGERLATASLDGTVKVWDPRSRAARQVEERSFRERLARFHGVELSELEQRFDREPSIAERGAMVYAALQARRKDE